ncbi:hypothetical protein CRYUN_Cryun27aG0078700 [Craigia yunnanensis]
MPPEWVYNMPITSKVDVDSYGIVLLELVTGRTSSMVVHGTDGEEEEEQGTLVKWVKEQMITMIGPIQSPETWMEVIIDPTLDGKYDKDEMLILVSVALKCIQDDKDARPTMGQVVHMLSSAWRKQ